MTSIASLFASLDLPLTGQPTTRGKAWYTDGTASFASYSPIDNQKMGEVFITSDENYERVMADAQSVFQCWRSYPAPKRGEVVRQIGEELRLHKEALGKLVSLECGKIFQEGLGEIQEAIDIADFAVGLSRQLYGLTMHSERPSHRMYEQWHPLGLVGIITAFNFPAAVWAWNAMIAAVCGDVCIWKPSEKTPLVALAMTAIAERVAARHGFAGLFGLVFDNDARFGKKLAADKRIALVSATGSTRMGRAVGAVVAERLGRSLLELGGNNAIILTPEADLNLVIPGVVFGSVGTAGQRCTTTRRLIVHRSLEAEVTKRLIAAYKQIKIGNPLEAGTLMGPLIAKESVDAFSHAVARAQQEGGEVLYGGKVLAGMPSDLYVEPTIIKANQSMKIVSEETFAPILYVLAYDELDEAIAINNGVDHGLSSSIFTNNLRAAERFLSAAGSDCGIANVNIGTSGAEIGGAFGGEKDTGGGRESGSDAWKAYMRRQTNTINYGADLPLAQGIVFG